MAILVFDLVSAAYNRSAANDPGKLATDDELIAHLSRTLARAWPLMARARPDQFGSSVLLTMTGSPPTGTLPLDLIDLVDIATATGVPVSLIPLGDRARTWHLAPCVYRQGRSLISRNLSGDPLANDVLTCGVLDQLPDLTALSDTLDLRWPRRQAQLLVDLIAVYLSVKDTGREGGEHAKIMGEMQASASAFAAEFGLRPEAVAWMHAPVELPSK